MQSVLNSKIDSLCIESLRTISMEEITKAKSGHPGVALGASPIMHTLFSRVLKYYSKEPNWINRDRFILAAGHASSLLYAQLHLAGYAITSKDLSEFRQLGSLTPGHPEVGHTPGVDCTSGPLGQGIPEAVGFAISEEFLRNRFGKEYIDHYTYVLCGDGDLQEGITSEAVSLAGHLGLSKLIVLFDSNDIQLDGPVKNANTENIKMKFESMGWNYLFVGDGEVVNDIHGAILEAQKSTKPTIIEVKTIIGRGAKEAGTSSVHGKPLSQEETSSFRTRLGGESFKALDECYDFYKTVEEKSLLTYNEYQNALRLAKESDREMFEAFINAIEGKNEINFDTLVQYDEKYDKATRVASGAFIDAISKKDPTVIGGSADLIASTYSKGADGNFTKENRTGRNINFGVREHAMAAISNGICLHGGLKPFCSGFFVFSDYLKPAIRLSSLMNLPVTYIFSHDSVAVGEDGPTHQPIEQLTMLRSIPNCNVIRPCDVNEMKQAMEIAYNSKKTPTVITTSRQGLKTVTYGTNELKHGAYILKEAENPLSGILIASGSEVSLCLETAKLLESEGYGIRVVSMPSTYLFDKESEEYKEKVLPKNVTKRLYVEMSEGSYLYKYVGLDGAVYGIQSFGISAPLKDAVNYFGFSPEKVSETFKKL